MAIILLVEDEPDLLKMTSSVLRRAGYDVREARHGEEALQRAQEGAPDLVVTDIMMPHMDGWRLVKSLRARRETAFTPILFLTQLDGYDDRVRGFRLGADDWLEKPYSPRELVRSVERMLDPDAALLETPGLVGAGSDMEGKLERIGLGPIMVMLEAAKKTGVLTLSCAAESCRVWLREGAAVRAELKGNPGVVDAEAVFHSLSWTHGTFDFIECDVHGDDRIVTATTYLLLEGARRIDEGA